MTFFSLLTVFSLQLIIIHIAYYQALVLRFQNFRITSMYLEKIALPIHSNSSEILEHSSDFYQQHWSFGLRRFNFVLFSLALNDFDSIQKALSRIKRGSNTILLPYDQLITFVTKQVRTKSSRNYLLKAKADYKTVKSKSSLLNVF